MVLPQQHTGRPVLIQRKVRRGAAAGAWRVWSNANAAPGGRHV